MLTKATVATALLAAVSVASPAPPAPRSSVVKRFEEGFDCTGDTVASSGTPGLFIAIDSDGITLSCEDAAEASSESGHQCYRSTEDTTKIGDRAKCPKDPPPARNPDGSDAAIVDGFIDAYCQNAGRPAIPNFIGCLLYGYYEANGDPVAQIETGAVAVCDLILSGACTWFINVAPELADSMNRPCEEDPESLACEFPYPG